MFLTTETWMIASLILVAANGLDMESAKKQACFPITHPVVVDPNWLTTETLTYYKHMNRLHLYLTASDLLYKDPSDVPEAGVYYDSQIMWDAYPNGTFISRGYGGRSRQYDSKQLGPGYFYFHPTEGTGFQGKYHAIMTDNKSFIVYALCTDDGYMTWGAISTIPNLSSSVTQKILNYVKSIGFDEEEFSELRYNSGHHSGWGKQLY